MNFQTDIRTAPKDGRRILAFVKGEADPVVIRWGPTIPALGRRWRWIGGQRPLKDDEIEHWAPVPSRDNSVSRYLDMDPSVLKYRSVYFQTQGRLANGMPNAKAWPQPDRPSYNAKMLDHLNLSGRGVEIGPLNIPMISKEKHPGVLYVDHLNTEGIKKKYAFLNDVVDVDRPMVNNSMADTLRNDAPLDYVLASHVMEHVPNPIRWLNEIAEILKIGGRVAIALPDRRGTFDFYRQETRASDIIAAYLNDHVIPDVRAVYDHHSQACMVNMHWARPDEACYPQDVLDGRGAVTAPVVAADPMGMTRQAQAGEYLDVHCWVFTPPSFLLAMAQIAEEGLLPFKVYQFYPTVLDAEDRSNHSIVAILEKTDEPATDIAKSYLMPLG